MSQGVRRRELRLEELYFFIVAVAFPTSVVSLHTRMRRFVIKRFKARAERLFFEAATMKRRVGRKLAGALVAPYVDSEDGGHSAI